MRSSFFTDSGRSRGSNTDRRESPPRPLPRSEIGTRSWIRWSRASRATTGYRPRRHPASFAPLTRQHLRHRRRQMRSARTAASLPLLARMLMKTYIALLLLERPHVNHALPWRRRRDAVRDQAEDQARDQTAEVGRVVDEGEAVTDGDVHRDPEEQLADEAARPRLVAVQRRAADREDERAHDSEYRAARADRGTFVEDRAGDPRHDAGGEEDQREALRSEKDFVQRAELVERPRVREPVQPADVEEHVGDQPPHFAAQHELVRERAHRD